MPNVQSLLAAQGTTFNEAYVSFPLCCPSSATILSGQYMHNHGVHGNFAPNGSWTRFIPHESNDLPVWLQNDGYYNVHIGKYMNGYGTQDGTLPRPAGLVRVVREGLRGRPLFQLPADREDRHAGYSADHLLRRPAGRLPDRRLHRSRGQLHQGQERLEAAVLAEPLVQLAARAIRSRPEGPLQGRRHATAEAPGLQREGHQRQAEVVPEQARRRIGKKQTKLIDNERRRQEEQLISVDQGVGELVQDLKDKGILDDTYIIFSSDNGFFRGEHRIVNGKYLPYDPASRVPLIIRGPGIPAGGVSNELVWNGDIPQTILQIAQGSQDNSLDGRSFLPYAKNTALRSTRPILLEGDTGPGGTGAESAQSSSARAREARVHVADKAGVNNLEQERDAIKSATNTNKAPAYRSIRTDRYEYTIYANGQTELYDMKRDPAQLHSLAHDPRYRYVRKWLYNALVPLSACAGPSCRIELGPDPAPLPKQASRKPAKP